MNENNTFYCSFVSVDYIICDCGDNFATEDALKEHLEKDRYEHQLKIDKKNVTVLYEYKCGTCEEIFNTAEECMQHQDLTHVDIIIKQEVKVEEEEEFVTSNIKQENDYDSYTKNVPPIRVQSIPLKVKPVNVIKVYQGKEKNKPVNLIEVSHPVKVKDEVEDDDEPDEQETTFENTFDEDLYRFIPRSEYLNHRWRQKSVAPKAAVLKERKERKKKKPTPYNYHDAICEVCGKKYASNVALRYHQRVHTGDRPYACLYCPKAFTMPLFQQIHMRIHTGEKPYQCSVCPKAFTNKAALLRHDRVHTGEKPYECPKCGKSFSQSNSMKLHVRTVHLKLPAPYKSRRRKAAALGISIQDFTEEQVVLYSEANFEDDGVQYCVQVAEAD